MNDNYNKRVSDAQKELDNVGYGIMDKKIINEDYGQWNHSDWEYFDEKKKEIVKKYDIKSEDIRY